MVRDISPVEFEAENVTKNCEPERLDEEEICIFAIGKFINWRHIDKKKNFQNTYDDWTLTFFSMTIDDII